MQPEPFRPRGRDWSPSPAPSLRVPGGTKTPHLLPDHPPCSPSQCTDPNFRMNLVNRFRSFMRKCRRMSSESFPMASICRVGHQGVGGGRPHPACPCAAVPNRDMRGPSWLRGVGKHGPVPGSALGSHRLPSPGSPHLSPKPSFVMIPKHNVQITALESFEPSHALSQQILRTQRGRYYQLPNLQTRKLGDQFL